MAERVCPVWVGYLLASPIRKIFQNPHGILAPYVKRGMKVLDVGSAMGFFSLPAAHMVGPDGKVICIDVQDRMLESLEKRARKAGVIERIETRLCRNDSLDLTDLAEAIDFALAFAVVHEVPDASAFFSQIYEALKPEAKILLSEPRGHVSEADFAKSISTAGEIGLRFIERININRSRSAVFEKKS
jgi:2-polyprenyl-3-methyl-5-hydroxy-6-metoxy-1,4-benzoquinol methylase